MASCDVSSFLEKANEIQNEIESLNHRLQELMDNFRKLPQDPQIPQVQAEKKEPEFIERIPDDEVANLQLFERVAVTLYDSDEESPADTPSDFSPSELESLNRRISELMDNSSESPDGSTPELPPVEDLPAEEEEPKEDLPAEVEESKEDDDEEEEQHEVDGVKVGLKQLPPFHLKGAKWRKEHCHLEVHKFRILHNNEKVGWCRLVVATSSMDLVEVEDGDEEIIIRKHPRLH